MQIDKYFSTPYEGYFVSKDGEVVSFRKPAAKSTPDKRIDYTRAPKKLSYKVDKDGYFEILFSINKKRIYKKVHQVVAETFLGPKPDPSYCVDHMNRNRQDNRVENLRWLPWSENSDGMKGKKPGVAKKCMYQGTTYGSIKDACKAAGITVNYYYSHPEIIAKTLAEGVETIEIRKVSRVGRKWLPVEAHTSSNA